MKNPDKWYFTGVPCKNGHIALRKKVNNACEVCAYIQRQAYENSEHYTEWKKKNKAKVNADYQKRNKGKVNAITRKYQASKMNRTPKWLDKDELERIKCYYKIAAMFKKETGKDWHVDHIIPLQGELVSGLHVYSNLRVIEGHKNIVKSNKYEI
jgi:hypothetical protein